MFKSATARGRGAFEKFPPDLEFNFRNGWTNNADVMSYLYTGTPALKTDSKAGKLACMSEMTPIFISLKFFQLLSFDNIFILYI